MKFFAKLSNQTLSCKELKVKEYKTLLKCVYGAKVEPSIYIETISEILSAVTEQDKTFFKKLNIVDIFCLLLDLRVNSQGNECSLQIEQNNKNITLNLNLNLVREDISSLMQNLKTQIKLNENVELSFECPSFERLSITTETDFISFINGISLRKNDKFEFYELSNNQEAMNVIDKLSSKALLEILDSYKRFAEKTSSINFFSRYNLKEGELLFLPTIEYLIWFTKLIFGEDIEGLYTNIFQLSVMANMSAEYIENCAVGEYQFFINCLKRMKAAQEAQQQSINIENQSALR